MVLDWEFKTGVREGGGIWASDDYGQWEVCSFCVVEDEEIGDVLGELK